MNSTASQHAVEGYTILRPAASFLVLTQLGYAAVVGLGNSYFPSGNPLSAPHSTVGVVSCSMPFFKHGNVHVGCFPARKSRHLSTEHVTHPRWCVFMLGALYRAWNL